VALIGAPDGFGFSAADLPRGVVILRQARGPLDVIVAFFDRRSSLQRRLPALLRALDPAGGLWIAWPKRSSGVATDLDENVVRACGLAAGLVDNKVCAIDGVWSGLRLVVRLRDR
jgi:alkylation response protein AidB-like acyl-CoA dehydrogenase